MELDGESLSVETIMKIGEGACKVKVCSCIVPHNWLYYSVLTQISEAAIARVKASREVVDDMVASNKGRLLLQYYY